MSIEVIKTPEGTLTLTREGRKLIKVNFILDSVAAKYDLDVLHSLDECMYCGCWLEQDHRGAWVDLADHFLCRESPSSMHAAK